MFKLINKQYKLHISKGTKSIFKKSPLIFSPQIFNLLRRYKVYRIFHHWVKSLSFPIREILGRALNDTFFHDANNFKKPTRSNLFKLKVRYSILHTLFQINMQSERKYEGCSLPLLCILQYQNFPAVEAVEFRFFHVDIDHAGNSKHMYVCRLPQYIVTRALKSLNVINCHRRVVPLITHSLFTSWMCK